MKTDRRITCCQQALLQRGTNEIDAESRRSCWLGPSHATRAEGHGTPSACSSLSVVLMLRKRMKDSFLPRPSLAAS